MGRRIVRRLLIIRLVISLIFDYFNICRIQKRQHGKEREAAVNQICANAGIRIRKTAFYLKGIIVKIGQFLSMRQDVLPQAFTKELEGLQDDLPPASTSSIRRLLEEEFGGKIGSLFKKWEEEPIAAASLAQVHKATLLDDTEVAVKIIRPGMERLARIDLDTLGLAAKVAQRIPGLSRKMNFSQLHQEFTETIQRELDCLQEISHMRRFEGMFCGNPYVKIPKVYENVSTRRVLVMEYMEGARVTDYEKLAEWKIDTAAMAETLVDVYLRQLLVNGFIHVDPHPGNLLILPDQRLCFLDFGMFDELTANEVHTLRGLLQSILFQDVEGVVSAFEQLGFLPADSNRQDVRSMLSHVLGRKGSSVLECKPVILEIFSGIRALLQTSSIQLQAKYMFLIRAAGILITVLSLLAPRANWSEILFRVGPPVFGTPVNVDNLNEEVK